MDGLKFALSSDSECGPNPALFPSWKSAKKTLENLKKMLNPVLGESLEDLHRECQHDLLQKTLLNPVQGDLEDLHAPSLPARPGAGMSTICWTISCWSEERNNTVGTSTNCSAVCGARRTVRAARGGRTILGTSITCSATRKSRGARKSTNCSTICGTTS